MQLCGVESTWQVRTWTTNMAKYVEFIETGLSDTGKTKRWDVVAKGDGFLLGVIKYFGRWKQYAFFPNENTVFEKTCLRDIAAFCADETSNKRRARSS